MKRTNERAIIQVIIATGISSVVTQLVTIREFITQFQGNEIIIALILFNWLILGASGTFAARALTPRVWPATTAGLGRLSLWLSGFSTLQILAARELRDVVFVHGSSVGFYPTWLYTFFIIAPYCLLLGFVLPYSLFVLRQADPDYPGARVYIADNIGDISGGALFAFALVYLVTPLQAILLAHLPLLAAAFFLFPVSQRRHSNVFLTLGLAAAVLLAGVFLEKHTLAPSEGKLAYYRETRYGRLTVHQDREQFALFEDGLPVSSNKNLSIAEETIHYPLAQLDKVDHILLISAEGGVMEELRKYPLRSVDYVELDPEVSAVQFRFGLLKKIPGLHVIHRDGRALLADSKTRYNAIIVNLPEPETFQINRFYTDRFFALAKARLLPGGVLSFSMQGFENYLAEPQRQKLSSLYNTVSAYFKHVLLLPGQKVFFLCGDRPIQTDIPAALAKKGITTTYIRGFYYGDLTAERIDRLNRQIDPSTPANRDNFPYLLRVMFFQWFAKYQTSPLVFIIAISTLTLIYLLRISREEFVLFSTGAMTMGGEILVIFAFQIFFGYIYLQIGIIITVFLAGLLPGAWFGQRLRRRGKPVLAVTDIVLILLLGVLIPALNQGGDHLPVEFFLVFGFAVSLVCGFQFPVTLYLRGSDNVAATRAFSADLIGAGCGTLFTSTVLIPYFGIIWATAGLMGLKLLSLILITTARRPAV